MSTATPPNQPRPIAESTPSLSLTTFLHTQQWLHPSHDCATSSTSQSNFCAACCRPPDIPPGPKHLCVLATFHIGDSAPLAFASAPSAPPPPVRHEPLTAISTTLSMADDGRTRLCFGMAGAHRTCVDLAATALINAPEVHVTDAYVALHVFAPFVTLVLRAGRWPDERTCEERARAESHFTAVAQAVALAMCGPPTAGRQAVTTRGGLGASAWERWLAARRVRDAGQDGATLADVLDEFAGAGVALIMPPVFPYFDDGGLGDSAGNSRLHEGFVDAFAKAELALRECVERADAWVGFATTRQRFESSNEDVMLTSQEMEERREETRKQCPPR